MIRVWHRSLRAAVCLCGALAPGSALAAGGESGAGILFWQALNLTILFAVLWFFARKPLVAWFRERRDRIEGEVESAAKLQREAEERHAHWQRKLAELAGELEEIRRTARGRAETERERILEDARAAYRKALQLGPKGEDEIDIQRQIDLIELQLPSPPTGIAR